MITVNSPVILPRLIAGYPGHVSEIQQMPYGVGTTFPELVDVIARWIPEELIPYMISLNKNNDGIIDLLNGALKDQTDSIQTQLATVLAEIIAGQNTALNDGTVLAAIKTLNSVTLAFLDRRFGGIYMAPPPSGGDDTDMLQALVAAAQATHGMLQLQEGTYIANPSTLESFQQPIVAGRGEERTIIQAATTAKPAFTFRGGSGSISGGGLRDLSLRPAVVGQGIGLMYRDAGGVQSYADVQQFSEGVVWSNEDPGGFTEFSTFEGPIVDCNIPGHYKRNLGDRSFHGSGFVGNTVITGQFGDAAILIDDGCLPYNAPLSATVFPHGAGKKIIQNNSNEQVVNFFGNLRIEGDRAIIGGGNKVAMAGTIQGLSGNDSGHRLGKFYLVDKVYMNGGNINIAYKPFGKVVTLGAGTTQLTDEGLTGCIVQIDIVGPNYNHTHVVHCWQNPSQAAGVVSEFAAPSGFDQAALGAPQFTYNNYNLYVTNNKYSSAVKAYVKVLPIQNDLTDDRLTQ